ncbi:hypothetical protein BH09ACT8_BH09ACT8_39650 [soil metagenome]
MTDFDAQDSEFHAEPYPMYAELRAHAPVFWYEDMGFWLLTRYRDVAAAVKNPRIFSHESFQAEPVSRHDPADSRQALVVDSFSKIMLYKDGEAHARMRRQSNRTFTPGEVGARRSFIEHICRDLLQQCREEGSFDYAQQFATVVPSMVIADYLGVAPKDRDEIRELADKFSVIFEPFLSEQDRTQMLLGSVPLVEYFDKAIEDRRRTPKDDFVSLLVSASEDDGGMSTDELRGNLLHLIVAGNETTTNLLEHLIVQLTRFPELRAAVREDPQMNKQFIEETLRYEAPIQMMGRMTTTAVEIDGVTIPEGGLVALVVGSANRDEAKFPDPDTFDPIRKDKAHMSFGQGSHFCLGAPLARLEASVALDMLCGEFRDLVVDPDATPTWKPDQLLRGYTHLQVLRRDGVVPQNALPPKGISMLTYTEPPERVAQSQGEGNPALTAFANLDDFLAQLPETGPANPNEDGEKEQLGAVTGVHRFVEAPGDSETIRWHFVESGDPSNPTVVFLHGVPDSWWQWHYALEYLSDRYHCVADRPEGLWPVRQAQR